MNIEKLIELQEFEKDKQIEMVVFMNYCGTAGCHAGWTCEMTGFAFKPVFPCPPVVVTDDPRWKHAQSVLELTDHQAQFLFSSGSWVNTDDYCTPHQAGARLAHLIANNEAPADVMEWGKQYQQAFEAELQRIRCS